MQVRSEKVDVIHHLIAFETQIYKNVTVYNFNFKQALLMPEVLSSRLSFSYNLH